MIRFKRSATMQPQPIKPGPGQESVWDYPRPPRLERVAKRVRLIVDDEVLAETQIAYRVLETSHPPTFYLPPEDVDLTRLRSERWGTFCEWKGQAHYYSIVTPNRLIKRAAWSYPTPTPSFDEIAGYLSFYPSKLDQAFVGDDLVMAQPGDFYGGWVTPEIVGPFKGDPGTMGW
ncbi:MAG: DUF427 domain-containing protein [Planctomycetota bacterium]